MVKINVNQTNVQTFRDAGDVDDAHTDTGSRRLFLFRLVVVAGCALGFMVNTWSNFDQLIRRQTAIRSYKVENEEVGCWWAKTVGERLY